MLRWINLSLLVLFPLSWTAPLLRAGMLPLFGLTEISVLSGLHALWQTDLFLALVVALFALVAPMAKTLGLALLHWNVLDPRAAPALRVMGKLAMADIFLIAIYITIAKGVGVGRIEVAWGLYLFTGCILASLWISFQTEKMAAKSPD
ncbi:MAG: paraquat-inducible protein A [Pseudomonadota bacterium]